MIVPKCVSSLNGPNIKFLEGAYWELWTVDNVKILECENFWIALYCYNYCLVYNSMILII